MCRVWDAYVHLHRAIHIRNAMFSIESSPQHPFTLPSEGPFTPNSSVNEMSFENSSVDNDDAYQCRPCTPTQHTIKSFAKQRPAATRPPNQKVRSGTKKPAANPPLCLDFLNGKCTRCGCKYYHPKPDEIFEHAAVTTKKGAGLLGYVVRPLGFAVLVHRASAGRRVPGTAASPPRPHVGSCGAALFGCAVVMVL